MNIDNLNLEEIKSIESEINSRRNETKSTFQHYGSLENLNDSETKSMESEINSRRNEIKSTFQHYGSLENLNGSEIKSIESEINSRRNEIKSTFQHYGSLENLNDNDIRTMEAQVREKQKQDIPYREYLNGLIDNPIISDNQQFEDAVIRSMQSNAIMKNFTSNLVEKISEVTYGFKKIPKTDISNINMQKQKLENLVNIYIQYLYKLKEHEWTFYGSGNNIGLEIISSDMLEDLWQVQKQFNFTFEMPIPKNLGEQYGKAFERKGKMVPAITLMYDDLKNKNVNWHQVLIYNENELTNKQKKEEDVKKFDLARQEEIKNIFAYAHLQTQTEKLDTTSIRR